MPVSKYFYLLSLLFISSCMSCPEEALYSFDIQMQLDPLKEVYEVGDTLKISVSHEDNSLFDNFSKERIYFESASIPFRCTISEKDRGLYTETPFFDFNTQSIQDSSLMIIHNERGSHIRFNYGCPAGSDSLSFAFEVILNKKGLFAIVPETQLDYIFLYDHVCDSLASSQSPYDQWYFAEIHYKFDHYEQQLEDFYATYKANWGYVSENNAMDKKIFFINVTD